MATRTNKLITLGIVTAGIIYGCYPYVSGARMETASAPQKVSTASPRQLTPELPPVVVTDPFRLTLSTPKPITRPVTVQKPLTVKPTAAFDPVAVRASLSLQATCLGRQRLAMINGRLYAEGDSLPEVGATGMAVQVVRVEADRVLLRAAAHELMLFYGDGRRSTSTKTSVASPKRARPTGRPS